MKPKPLNYSELNKAPTGIPGLDAITQGGLARGRTTLLEGGPGSGKTILALQSLVNAAREHREPGIFVAFEESPARIKINAGKFGWDLENLEQKKLFFLDAQPVPDLVVNGTFDLDGMLAVVGAKAKEMRAKRIVFDALDIMLSLMDDPVAERREIYKLHDWLLASGLTAIITARADSHGGNSRRLDFMQFMVDCAITLNHVVVAGYSHRNMRVLKYRGSAFDEDESPFVIGDNGIEVASSSDLERKEMIVSNERISSGMQRLDTMLGGGYYRASSILITGFPGTAKSTLAGAFAEAACRRGERTLFVSFDSDANEVVRNLGSVNIRLQRFVRSGVFHAKSARAITGSAEIHLMRIRNMVRDHRARCLVIDPVSALSKGGNDGIAQSVAGRLIDWAKSEGITMLCTSLLDGKSASQMEGTPMLISTIADTWIHLNYLVNAGERNRGLSIVKSRGTSHSNQVRELILSNNGVTLADAYVAGGEVLMGTLRWEKELALRNSRDESRLAASRRRAVLESEEADILRRLKAIQFDLKAKRNETKAFIRREAAESAQDANGSDHLRQLRGVDVA